MSYADLFFRTTPFSPSVAVSTLRVSQKIAPSTSAALVLRVIGGIHVGAQHPLGDQGALLIGSAPDCDIVLADHDVQPHHCVVTRRGNKLSIRAFAVPLSIGDRTIGAGDQQALAAGNPIDIGDARLVIANPESPSDTASVPRDSDENAWSRGWQIVLGTIMVSGMLLLTFAALMMRQPSEPSEDGPEIWLHAASALIEQMSLPELEVVLDGADQIRVTGVIPSSSDRAALLESLDARGIPAAVDVRVGDEIAEDVREVLRLSGVESQARYLGDGRVEVRGALGDAQALETMVESRAMNDIAGLRQVIAHNLDRAPKPPAAPEPTDDKQVLYVVAGADPYVVTRDGSRYYRGAELPSGDRLTAIAPDALTLSDDQGRTLAIAATGERLDAVQVP